MNSIRLFDEATYARLHQLTQSTGAAPRLSPIQRRDLAALMKESSATDDADELARRVSLGDRVRLVSPRDPDDWYEFELVLPPDADVDADRISMFAPVGLAVIGQRSGGTVAWEVPTGIRAMNIASVTKAVPAGD